jgi:hypothetical protein
MNRVIEKMICLTKQFENRGFLQGEIYDIETITDRKKIDSKNEHYYCYIGFLDDNDNSYFNDDHAHHKIFKECFMPYTEWLAINREKQIRIVLDE